MLLQVNRIDLHYQLLGEGEPLLWLHGFMGSGSDWKFLVDNPPVGYQLIAPDLRGQGTSTNPTGDFTFRQAAYDVLALLRHLNVSRVRAIGVSGGGIVLLHMATIEAAITDRMVLVSAPPYFPEQARAIQRQFSEAMLPEVERERMRQRHTGGEKQIEQLFAITRGFADDYVDVNFTPQTLSAITAETLIVFGDRDPLYPLSLATELYGAIRKSYLWVVPNGGHGPVFREAAPRFVETAMSFLRGDWANT
jgi:pimeloyl-ACP methyl ester carboxylesterase